MKRHFLALLGALLAIQSGSTLAATLLGVTESQPVRLFSFDSGAPGTQTGTVNVTGLQTNEAVVAIDFRPSDNVLFALGNSGRLYTIAPSTGAATIVGSAIALTGFDLGMTFVTSSSLIQFVSETGANFTRDATSGANASSTNLSYASGDANAGTAPQVEALAANATGTIFGIDRGTDRVVTLNPSNGELTTVAALSVTTTGFGIGFDIDGATAYASFPPPGAPANTIYLYTVNLSTGVATSAGIINSGGSNVLGLSVAPAGVTLPGSGGSEPVYGGGGGGSGGYGGGGGGFGLAALLLLLSGFGLRRLRRHPTPD